MAIGFRNLEVLLDDYNIKIKNWKRIMKIKNLWWHLWMLKSFYSIYLDSHKLLGKQLSLLTPSNCSKRTWSSLYRSTLKKSLKIVQIANYFRIFWNTFPILFYSIRIQRVKLVSISQWLRYIKTVIQSQI